jgi:TonB family protein
LAGMRLREIVTAFVFALAVIGSCYGADDRSSMVEALNKSYVGKDAMLRGFYCDSRLEYDATGNHLRSPRSGAWTVCGFVKVRSIKVENFKLEIEAQRIGIEFDDRKMVQVPGKPVKIGVLLADGFTSGSVQGQLNEIFFDKENLVDVVPDYWKCYLSPNVNRYCAQTKELVYQHSYNGDEKPRGPISAPQVISDPGPAFDRFARGSRFGSKVIFRIEVSEAGIPENIKIVRPVGLGTDEVAFEALRKWRFKPATRKDGSPARVEITIEFNFGLK